MSSGHWAFSKPFASGMGVIVYSTLVVCPTGNRPGQILKKKKVVNPRSSNMES